MGRDNNTFEKMQRERLKKQKADDKRARRKKRKEDTAVSEEPADDNPERVRRSVQAQPK
ncbi:MAG: hypothetical protein GXX96_17875 [Planctomycetaceae bacterium]|nr:hypothetical protein [Planctomycetaceae bacterium]